MDGSPDRTAAAHSIIEHRRPRADPGLPDSLERVGVFNFRDLASAQLNERLLRSGLLFRSDGINRCRSTEAQLLADLGVRRVLDLRTDDERSIDGVFEHPTIVTVHVPMIENLESLVQRLDADRVNDDFMSDHYLSIAANNSGAIALCIAEIIASAVDDEAVIVHCTSGKDRTGIVASLALALAGVDDQRIGLDYARSSTAVPKLASWRRDNAAISTSDELTEAGFTAGQQAQLMSASPATIIAFLNGIRRHYGSVEDYLAWGGTDRTELDRVGRAFA